MITALTQATGLNLHQLAGVILLTVSAFCWGLAGRIPHTALWWTEVEPDAEPLEPVAGRIDRARNWLYQRNLDREAERAADDRWSDTLTTVPAVPAEPAWRPETPAERIMRESFVKHPEPLPTGRAFYGDPGGPEIPMPASFARQPEPLPPLPPQPAGPGAVDMHQLYRTGPTQPRLRSGVYAFQPDTAVITGVITDAGRAQREYEPEPETQQVTAVAPIVPPSIELNQSIQARFARMMAESEAGPVTRRVRELINAGP